MFCLMLFGCSEKTAIEPETISYTVEVSPRSVSATAQGLTEGVELTINTTAPSWKITRDSDKDWAYTNITTGLSGTSTIKLFVRQNSSVERTSTLTLSAYGCEPIAIVVTQEGAAITPTIPENIPDDSSNMATFSSVALVPELGIAWNLGNSLDAISSETAWGNPVTTKELIDAVKAAGFKTVRLPVSWAIHYNAGTDEINSAWIARVREVVDYCIDNDMFVILNEHWDNGWLNDLSTENRDALSAKLANIWKQVAIYFRDYDYRLMFAGANEVNDERGITATSHDSQNAFMQTFVNTVRATGGRNAYRYLVIQSINTDIEHLSGLTIPTDKTTDRILVECHYYTPWGFCGEESYQSWIGAQERMYLWDKYLSDKTNAFYTLSQVEADMQVFGNFCSTHNIGGILGEFGVQNRVDMATSAGKLQEHNESRAWWFYNVSRLCGQYKICPAMWDNGPTGNNCMGIFDRGNKQLIFPNIANAISDGYAGRGFTYL